MCRAVERESGNTQLNPAAMAVVLLQQWGKGYNSNGSASYARRYTFVDRTRSPAALSPPPDSRSALESQHGLASPTGTRVLVNALCCDAALSKPAVATATNNRRWPSNALVFG